MMESSVSYVTSTPAPAAESCPNGSGIEEAGMLAIDSDRFILKQPVHMIIIYSFAYGCIFLLGICGNALVILVVFGHRHMHTVTNYFIVNLAVADVLVCVFCLPITLLSNLYAGWAFGAFMCKATPFLQGISVSASVNSLMAIALDRYMAICQILKFYLSRKLARSIIFFIWIFAAALMTPWAIFYNQERIDNCESTYYICRQTWPTENLEKSYFLIAIFLMCYVIPLTCITVCYVMIGYRVCHRNAHGVRITHSSAAYEKSKVKVFKMLVLVVILFAFSWLLLYIVNLRLYFGGNINPESTEFQWLIQVLIPVAQWAGSANSCVNPIVYCFFSNKFRNGFRAMLRCRRGTAGDFSNSPIPATTKLECIPEMNTGINCVTTSKVCTSQRWKRTPIRRKSAENSSTF